jgi:pyruvate/2-oxoglutarate dehydrogenase complex dihydrolipoamide dehydrogenase (E3) component
MEADVLIIGSGQAGVPLATRLAGAGRRVILVERSALGGTCVNYGCTPTKTMIASARAAHVARSSARLGVHAGDVRVDLGEIVDRKERIVHEWRDGVSRRLRSAGDRLTVIEGQAQFVGDREVVVGGARHRAEIVIVNVGARPSLPPIRGLAAVPWLDNARLMALRDLPTSLLVIGGGYIACELGQMFRRFGAGVVLIERGEHLLSHEEPEISTAIETVFRREGIAIELGAQVTEVSRERGEIVVHLEGGRSLRGSHLLVATGRAPNTADLGCDAAGIARDPHGFIVVDDHYRTSAPGVYAVGDVTPGPQFTHASWDDHRILFDLLVHGAGRGRSDRTVPYTVFTDPQIAGVGLSEREARSRGIAYEAATMPFAYVARAIEIDETDGIMKVLIDPKSERILGASLMGSDAGELVHIFVGLMRAGATARAIVDAEFVHPTFAEGVQSLVMRLGRYSLA